MDDADAEAVLRRLVRPARAARRRVRRLDAEGPRDVHHQRDQDRRLPADAHGSDACIPLAVAYAVVGFGAAAYSPAKYGILTELLPPQQLVVANGWIEGTTVASIILGVAARRAADQPAVVDDAARLRPADASTPASTRAPEAAIIVIVRLLRHRRDLQPVHPGHRRRPPDAEPQPVLPDPRVRALRHAAVARQARPDLARDDDAVLGRRRDAAVHRAQVGGESRSASTCRRRRSCRASSRVGIAVGAVVAARYVSLRGAVDVLPIGVAMGLIVIAMIFVTRDAGRDRADDR